MVPRKSSSIGITVSEYHNTVNINTLIPAMNSGEHSNTHTTAVLILIVPGRNQKQVWCVP